MKKNYYKLLLIALLGISNIAKAQTTLVAGDIAFTGYICQNTPDEFSFILLRDIASGTQINFTDNGWNRTGTTTGNFTIQTPATTETIITWLSNSNIPTGAEIKITGTAASIRNGGTATAGTVTGTALSLSTVGDQILAYQGTTVSPVFISAIHMNKFVAGDPFTTTTESDWDTPSSISGTGLPAGLTSGVNAIWVTNSSGAEVDNTTFNCSSFDLSTVAKIKSLIYNKINWNTNDGNPSFTLPTVCRYMDPTLSSNEFELNNKVFIYPNPFSDEITFQTERNFKTIEMYSILGQKVLLEKFKKSYNTSNLSTGLYVLKLTDFDGNTIERKVLKN